MNNEQRRNFAARMYYIAEIPHKLNEWTNSEEIDLFTFLNRLELDLYINVGICSRDAAKNVSSWVVHCSWIDGDISESKEMIEFIK